MASRSRAICPDCEGSAPLRKDGTFCIHTVGSGPYVDGEVRHYCNYGARVPVVEQKDVKVTFSPTDKGQWSVGQLSVGDGTCTILCRSCVAHLTLHYGQYSVKHNCAGGFEISAPVVDNFQPTC